MNGIRKKQFISLSNVTSLGLYRTSSTPLLLFARGKKEETITIKETHFCRLQDVAAEATPPVVEVDIELLTREFDKALSDFSHDHVPGCTFSPQPLSMPNKNKQLY